MTLSSQLKYATIALAVIVADQTTKYFAYNGRFGSFLNTLLPVFGKLLLPNYNFAFSLPFPHFLAYIFYAIVFAVFAAWYFSGNRNVKEGIGFYLVLGGAISNLVDRAMLGYVRDFVYAFWGNVFNLADVAIVAGIILILIASLYRDKTLLVQK